MKKYRIYWINLPIILSIIFAVERFCHHQTDGFRPYKIASTLNFNPMWDCSSFDQESPEEISAILNQPFYFLGSGGQSYAFLSEDKKFVLKFFKHHHMDPEPFLESIPLPSFLHSIRRKRVEIRKNRLESIFNSCKLAYLVLKQETGLIYIHLNRTDFLNQVVTIFDKLNIAHQLDLDQTTFVIQKKADLALEKIQTFILTKDEVGAKKCLQSLVKLIIKRSEKGILDQDPAIKRNFGFINYEAVEIDIGAFEEDPFLKDARYSKKDLFFETLKLKKWIKKHDPSLSSYLDEEINSLLISLSQN